MIVQACLDAEGFTGPPEQSDGTLLDDAKVQPVRCPRDACFLYGAKQIG